MLIPVYFRKIRTVPSCGVGFELALLLPALMGLRRLRRRGIQSG